LFKDDQGNVIGILPQAFELRAEEAALSVNWLEFHVGDEDTQILRTVRSFRQNRDISLTSKCAFGIANIGDVKNVCLHSGTKVRVVHSPSANNPAHAEVRELPRDNLELLESLAVIAFSKFVLNTSISK
jgi:hypothetical protein